VRARGRGRSRAPHHVEQEAEELLGERAALDRQQQLHELGLLLVRLHDRVVEHALALRELLFARDRRRVDVARRRRRRVQQRRRRRRCRWCVFAVGGLERCCGAIVVRRIGGGHRVVACHETRVSATATEIHGVRERGAFDGGCAAACCNLSCRGRAVGPHDSCAISGWSLMQVGSGSTRASGGAWVHATQRARRVRRSVCASVRCGASQAAKRMALPRERRRVVRRLTARHPHTQEG